MIKQDWKSEHDDLYCLINKTKTSGKFRSNNDRYTKLKFASCSKNENKYNYLPFHEDKRDGGRTIITKLQAEN